MGCSGISIKHDKNFFLGRPNINNGENQSYCSEINSKYRITIEQFTEIIHYSKK